MYREALASLWYGLKEERGFMALVAEPGMGKTTLLFQLLQRLRTTSARTVFLFQTCCDSSDLIRYLLQDLGICPAPDAAFNALSIERCASAGSHGRVGNSYS